MLWVVEKKKKKDPNNSISTQPIDKNKAQDKAAKKTESAWIGIQSSMDEQFLFYVVLLSWLALVALVVKTVWTELSYSNGSMSGLVFKPLVVTISDHMQSTSPMQKQLCRAHRGLVW